MDIHLVVQLRLLSQMMISHWRNIMGIEPISDEERDNMKRYDYKTPSWTRRFNRWYEI